MGYIGTGTYVDFVASMVDVKDIVDNMKVLSPSGSATASFGKCLELDLSQSGLFSATNISVTSSGGTLIKGMAMVSGGKIIVTGLII